MKICEKCFGSNEVCYVCRGQGSASSFTPKKSKSTQSKTTKYKSPVLTEQERAVLADIRKSIRVVRSSLPTQKCPMCNGLVACKRLEKHMLNKCPARQQRESTFRPIEKPRQINRVRKTQTAELDCSDSPLAYQRSESDISEEAFRQEFSDSYDATRGMGQTSRDNGSFGSHPSHDDHGDESFS